MTEQKTQPLLTKDALHHLMRRGCVEIVTGSDDHRCRLVWLLVNAVPLC